MKRELFLSLRENINAHVCVLIGIFVKLSKYRPRLEVLYLENDENKKLGTIVNPWYFCNIGCHVLDINDKLKYVVEASCC